MIKVDIKNKSGQIGWSSIFNTQDEANSWVTQESNNNSWGKPERWIREGQEDVSGAIDQRTVEDIPAIPETLDENGNVTQEAVPAVTHVEYKLSAEYSVEQTDISSEVQAENLLINGLKAQQVGATVIAKVWAINESKNISAETFAALIADSNIERIERMLWTGSLRTAKLMIQALDNTYFTNEEKQSILDMLADY